MGSQAGLDARDLFEKLRVQVHFLEPRMDGIGGID
jgi:hypothetical protein